MKIVINKCFGGFGLSPLALKEYAKLKGKECYFFKVDFNGHYTEITLEEASNDCLIGIRVFTTKNPNLFKTSNEEYSKINLDGSDIPRDDKDLIAVIEKLGSKKASGVFSELKIVEIPDDVEYTIEQYDGSEHIAEVHNTWD